MEGIAKADFVCRVCGGTVQKGKHTIKWAPNIKASARHSECYGKPDKFDAQGKSLDGLDDVTNGNVGGFAPIPTEEPPSKPETDDDGKDDPPFEPNGEEEKEQDSGEDKAEDSKSGGQSQDEQQFMTKAGFIAPDKAAAIIAPHMKIKLDPKPIIEQAVKAATTAVNGKGVEKSAVVSLVQEELAKFASDKGAITVYIKKADDSVTKMDGLQHKDTPKLIKLLNRRKNVYMHGPAGSGKSTAARKCAAAIKTEAHPDGLPFYYLSLNPQSSPTRIEGYQTPHGEYVMTLFRRGYQYGGLVCADEVDNSSANLWTSINNAIDSDLGSFPDGMIQRHPDFIFVGTGNTNLSGDAIYRDRKALDKATISRFVFLYWDYDQALEKAITLSRNNKATPWLNWLWKLRNWAKLNNPSLYTYCHPRAAYDGADMLADGFPVQEVVEHVVFKHTFDETAKKAALMSCPLPKEQMSL